MSPRKPIPKTQSSISTSKQKPLKEIEGRSTAPSSDSLNTNSNIQETGIDFDRSGQMSYKGDTTKQFSVGIQDIDEAVFYYFKNVIKPFIYQNGTRREVPITYGSSERWVQFQKTGTYRDKNGAVMLPSLIIKRNSLTKDRSISNKLDANMPNLYGTYSRQFSPKNFYSNFSTLNNRKPVETFQVVAQPDYVTLEYSCLIQTYYMEQLNKIIEACEYSSDAYWGNPERFQFRAFIDSFSTATEISQGSDRLVKGTFNIRLRGYIIPDTIQKDLNSIKKFNSKAKVTITSEIVSNINDIDKISNPTSDNRKRI